MKTLLRSALLLLPAAAGLLAAVLREPHELASRVFPATFSPESSGLYSVSRPSSRPVPGLTDQMHANIAETQRSLNAAREVINGSNEDARREFRMLAGEIELIRSRLNRSLRATETASADEWEAASFQLAADYDSYVQAVAAAQRLAAANNSAGDLYFDRH
jgi:hypothetical protein